MFYFLFLNMLLLLLTISSLSIISTYLQLRHSNPLWHWRSFLTASSCGLYIGAYTFYYMVCIAKMNMWEGELIYFVWAGLLTYSVAVMCGGVGVVASGVFVETIYRNIKND